MKKNVGLIGRGNWGNIIKKKLINLSNLKFVIGKNSDLTKLFKKNNINWIFVATPNQTHFKIVKKCLNSGVNVFCEKPLSLTAKDTKYLINLSKKNKTKIFISDLYSFYSKKIKILKNNNFIYRSKFVKKLDNEFLYRFMYHDISILCKYFRTQKLSKLSFKKDNKNKIFQIFIETRNKRKFEFKYNLKSPKKVHLINNFKISTNRDLLKEMINKILKNDIDFRENNNKALFISEFLDNIRKKI